MTYQTVVLIIDDDPLILMVMQQMVQRAIGAATQILTAQNGEEGLRKAVETHPQVIITDLMMPRMDGYDMVQSLRREECCEKARIIGMSSASALDPRTKEFRKLCDGFVGKPFKPHDVEAVLRG
ncbi:MAG: response regulator [Anaerolineae bacterium]